MTTLPTLTADMRIVDVPGLSLRILNALAAADDPPTTVREVAMMPDADLLRLPNFGKASLRSLREAIPTWIETPVRPDRCERCHFWDGRCHHSAPRDNTLWPKTPANEWCGDFKERRAP